MTELDRLIKNLEERHSILVHQSLDNGHHDTKIFADGRVSEIEYIIKMIKNIRKSEEGIDIAY